MCADLHILKTLKQGYALISKHSDQPAPNLSVLWEKNRPFDCGSCYQNAKIYLGGGINDPDEFDESVIIHEMGHYFIDYWSDDDSPGGSHRLQKVDPRLAYGEGIAYFWTGLVANSPIIEDDMVLAPWVVDMERIQLRGEAIDLSIDNGNLNGNYREELVSGLIWDSYDPSSEEEQAFDQIKLSEANIMSILLNRFPLNEIDLGATGIDLSDFIKAVSCEEENQSLALLSLVNHYQYPIDQDTTLVNLVNQSIAPTDRQVSCDQKSQVPSLEIQASQDPKLLSIKLPHDWWQQLPDQEKEQHLANGLDIKIWEYQEKLISVQNQTCFFPKALQNQALIPQAQGLFCDLKLDGYQSRPLILAAMAKGGPFAKQWISGNNQSLINPSKAQISPKSPFDQGIQSKAIKVVNSKYGLLHLIDIDQ
jgi:hypothetical protein